MNTLLENELKNYLAVKKLDSSLIKEFELLKQKNPKYGDFSTNFPLKVAKITNKNPLSIAEAIGKYLNKHKPEFCLKITVSKPGFINFFLNPQFTYKNFLNYLDSTYKPKLGKIFSGKLNYEFVSANPTGFLHVGHARNAVVGDTIVRVMEYLGFEVVREYYINNGGKQINSLAEAVYFFYAKKHKRPVNYELADIQYTGKEVEDLGMNLPKLVPKIKGFSETEAIKFLTDFAPNYFLEKIKEQLLSINVKPFTIFTSEKELLTKKTGATLKALEETEYFYLKDGAYWLQTSEFGDDKDRILIKQNHEYTYLVADISNHIQKFENGFNVLYDLWGADHHGYEKRVRASLEILGYNSEALKVDFINMVKIAIKGKEFKMSKRAGTSVTVLAIAKLIDLSIFRYFLLSKTKEQNLKLDLEALKAKVLTNSFYYIEYTNARIAQLMKYFEKVHKVKITTLLTGYQKGKYDLLLTKRVFSETEIKLMNKVFELTNYLKQVIKRREPNWLFVFLKELAILFNSYYNNHTVISSDQDESIARIFFIIALSNIFRTLFNLMGIAVKDKV